MGHLFPTRFSAFNNQYLSRNYRFCSCFPLNILNQNQSQSDLLLSYFTVNCVDRHMQVDPDRCAIIWEKDEPGDVQRVSYR